jgi:hypothetical protein
MRAIPWDPKTERVPFVHPVTSLEESLEKNSGDRSKKRSKHSGYPSFVLGLRHAKLGQAGCFAQVEQEKAMPEVGWAPKNRLAG